MQAEDGPSGLLHFAGRQEVIEVGVRVKNLGHGQTELPNLMKDPFRRSSGVYDDGLFAHGIADDRAIAAKRGH